MKKGFFSICLILSITNLVWAQIVLYPAQKEFKDKSMFRISEVIDARLEKENVGLIINKAAKRIDTIRLNDRLEVFLKNCLDSSIVPSIKKNQPIYPLILKINALEFNKRLIEDQEIARFWIYCDFEILSKNDDGTFTEIIDGKECLEASPYKTEKDDYTDDGFFSLLHWVFWERVKLRVDAINLNTWVTNGEHKTKPNINIATPLFPIAQDDSLRPGIYTTMEEFLANDPKMKFSQFKNGELYKEIGKTPIKITIKDNIYGFCNGKYSYINLNSTNKYLPIERLGTVFEFATLKTLKVYNINALDAIWAAHTAKNFITVPVLPTPIEAMRIIDFGRRIHHPLISMPKNFLMKDSEVYNIYAGTTLYEHQRIMLLPESRGILVGVPFIRITEKDK